MTDVRGRPLDFSRGRTLSGNVGIVATNGMLHRAVLDAVRRVLYPETAYYVTIEGKSAPSETALARMIAAALKLDVDAVTVELAEDETSTDETESLSSSVVSSDDDSTADADVDDK